MQNRECYDDNGLIGGTVSVGGVASTTAPALGHLRCATPTTSSALNSVIGVSGLVRLTLPGTASFN
jgi:hypothetical protein